jgi:tRNA(Ile)-lysidine synthase
MDHVNVDTLTRQVDRFLEEYDLKDQAIVVALSGGPDSMALARALLALTPSADVPIVFAHLNHQLRGQEGDEDQAFVEAFHHELVTAACPVRLRIERANVRAIADESRTNLEAAARAWRYRMLVEIAGQEKIKLIATGHTADDQAETLLHHIVRGTGIQGLRGIAPRRRLAPGILLIRPLLYASRAQIISYLRSMNQPFRTDSSNYDPVHMRNCIRHELLPQLTGINPAISLQLAQLARQAAVVHSRERSLVKRILRASEMPRAGDTLVFRKMALRSQPRHLIRAVFRSVWERETWPRARMNFRNWDRLAALVMGEVSSISLPGGVSAHNRERVVQLRKPS